MHTIRPEDLIKFLVDNIEPINDNIYGHGYRASVILTDGTYLPCVLFRNKQPLAQLARKRFEEEKGGLFHKPKSIGYDSIVEHFVTSGNKLNEYDISIVEKSKCAFPLSVLKKIRGETTMAYTGFVLKMKDGKHFGFGTSFLMDFFQMPENYSGDDIVDVINHSYISSSGQVSKHKVPFSEWPNDYDEKAVHRERPYFECYLDNLP